MLKDAQIKSSREEYVGGIEQRSNDVAVMDAQITLWEEECARGMGQR